MVRIENGRLQSLEASEAQSQMQLVVPATTITTTNTTTICHKHKSELQLAPNVCCGLRVFRATCGLWQTAATYVSGCLPACLPATTATSVIGDAFVIILAGVQRRLKNARITWPLTELKKRTIKYFLCLDCFTPVLIPFRGAGIMVLLWSG